MMGRPEMVTSINDVELGELRNRNHNLNQHQHEVQTVPHSEYHERFVRDNLPYRPWIAVLDEFMKPEAKGFAVDRERRMRHFDVKVIHIFGNSESITECTSAAEFEKAIREHQGKEQIGTIVIAKDLSRAMIDALGMEYELEPEFFASHLEGTESFGMGAWESPTVRTPARVPCLMPDYLREAPFYVAQYRRAYYVEHGSAEIFELRTTATNVARGAYVLDKELPDIFVAEKISVYRKPGSNIGIILTDPLLSSTLPSSYIRSPITVLRDQHPSLPLPDRSKQISSRGELLIWLERLHPTSRAQIFTSPEPIFLRPVLKLTERAGHMFLSHARQILSRMLNRFCDDMFPDNIPFFLNVSRNLHRHLNNLQVHLRHAMLVASVTTNKINGPWDGAWAGEKAFANQIHDFGFLIKEMDRLLKSLEEDVRFLASIASIREGKIVGWAGKFAAVFLPVSLLATILSISEPGYVRWVILAGLSVPFVLIAFYFIFIWRPPHVDQFSYGR